MNSILVVEDNDELRQNLNEILSSEGYEVLLAENGAEGYEIASEKLPDLVLSDIKMPEMSGLEMLQKLQGQNTTYNIPVILFSAFSEMTDIRKGMSIGADDYITKPFNIDDLLNAIQVRLKKKKKSMMTIDAFKNNVLKAVAHELRTPLISILSYPQMLRDNLDILTPEDIRDIAENMHLSGNLLYRNVEKILVYSELLYLSEKMAYDSTASREFFTIGDEQLVFNFEKETSTLLIEHNFSSNFAPGQIAITKEHFFTLINEMVYLTLVPLKGGRDLKISGSPTDDKYQIIISINAEVENDLLEIEQNDSDVSNENRTGRGLCLGQVIIDKILELYGGKLTVKNRSDIPSEIIITLPRFKNIKP